MEGMKRISLSLRIAWLSRFLAGALLLTVPAVAQPSDSNQARVAALGLGVIESARVSVAFSDSVAGEIASGYAAEAIAAAAWYRSELDWQEEMAIAVLDADDFRRVTAIPYPSPHAETRTGFIIIADRVDGHPGFGLWDVDERDINLAWMLHEIGHVIAHDLGIGSANPWVNELIASVIMAGYINAERTQFAGFQSGMPPRFAGEGNYASLVEFDRLYFAMGQFDYLWFHFHIADLANYVIEETGDLGAAMERLGQEFPAGRPPETVDGTLLRLEQIAPGISALAALLMSALE